LRAEEAGDPGALPTPGQLKVIRHLWNDLSEYIAGANQTAFQRAFYERRLGIPALGPQTRAQANAVMLKQRVSREMRKTNEASKAVPRDDRGRVGAARKGSQKKRGTSADSSSQPMQ
jgi:hypothetical protein